MYPGSALRQSKFLSTVLVLAIHILNVLLSVKQSTRVSKQVFPSALCNLCQRMMALQLGILKAILTQLAVLELKAVYEGLLQILAPELPLAVLGIVDINIAGVSAQIFEEIEFQ